MKKKKIGIAAAAAALLAAVIASSVLLLAQSRGASPQDAAFTRTVGTVCLICAGSAAAVLVLLIVFAVRSLKAEASSPAAAGNPGKSAQSEEVSVLLARLAETEAALKRVEIYRNAMHENMSAYMEINLTQGIITDGPFLSDSQRSRRINLADYSVSNGLDQFTEFCVRRFAVNESREYASFNTVRNLINEYGRGRRFAEIDFSSQWLDNRAHEFRQCYYMTRQPDDGNIIALCMLYDMTEKYARDKKIQKLTEELDRSRVQISAKQMQPHFLYNVLGSIREIILDDPQYASDLICDFTTYLRACIRSMSNDILIPFEQEIDNVKAYVNIEKMRFGDRIQVYYDLRYTDFKVVPLSIQPLVENAVRHGLFPKEEGGSVTIRSERLRDSTVITVDDDGVGFNYQKIKREIREGTRDSTGLSNLTMRLEKIMRANVRVDSEPDKGARITITIPDKKGDMNDESTDS